ncbi:MAG: 30S ribosomal protein S18 [Candidatus Moraniibacteriota bacterium]|nr:MAG: 30S ribosomal protein S18 [Candidatus Moranbacteria bacterium]
MQKKKVRLEKPVVGKADAGMSFDYKDSATLSRFVTEKGRILSRSRTGLSAKSQRALMKAVKRARMLALLPFAN